MKTCFCKHLKAKQLPNNISQAVCLITLSRHVLARQQNCVSPSVPGDVLRFSRYCSRWLQHERRACDIAHACFKKNIFNFQAQLIAWTTDFRGWAASPTRHWPIPSNSSKVLSGGLSRPCATGVGQLTCPGTHSHNKVPFWHCTRKCTLPVVLEKKCPSTICWSADGLAEREPDFTTCVGVFKQLTGITKPWCIRMFRFHPRSHLIVEICFNTHSVGCHGPVGGVFATKRTLSVWSQVWGDVASGFQRANGIVVVVNSRRSSSRRRSIKSSSGSSRAAVER